ncbi:MAG TPA: CocE/NonD family hydrolase [Acidimicrobiales bacterium]|nr:CocE/NonD family hydrolase [Acidimicrobiales bacterium]
MPHSIRIDYDVEMKTRDGVILRADVVRPDINAKVPAIVSRTPYNKGVQFATNRYCPPWTAAQAGYAYVLQDIRGRFASEGEWDFKDLTAANVDDGYDTIEWVASQPWSDGNVGMAGGSYVAETQIAAAMSNPPHLRAIAPSLMGMGPVRAIGHGSLPLESMTIGWMSGLAIDRVMKLLPTGGADPADLTTLLNAMTRPDLASQTLPLRDLLTLRSAGMPRYTDTVEMVENVVTLKGGHQEKLFHVPALWTWGWYDNAGGADQFNLMRETSATEVARNDTRMIIGPWTHNFAGNFVGCLGVGGLGSAEGSGVAALHLKYYDRHLRGADVDIAPVRYFVLGVNEWREADAWPIPGTEFQRWYLHSRGRANSAAGDGVLSRAEPVSSESPDCYEYNPHDPAPSWGFRVMYTGGTTVAGPYEQTRVEQRDDVLCYTSPPFTEPTELVGDITANLWFSTDVKDTDFVVKLCVVWPGGTSINLADGAVRARYRDGYTTPSLLEPGAVYGIEVQLGPCGYRFEPGMSVRLQITSSAFPHLDRNMNTGNSVGDDASGPVAHTALFHDAEHPSYVTLPIQPEPGPMVLPPLPF